MSAALEAYDETSLSWWNGAKAAFARLIVAWGATIGLLPLGLGYTLVFWAMFNGRINPMTYQLFLPASAAILVLTWGLGSNPHVRPWNTWITLSLVVGWFVASAIIGGLMTAAPRDHGWIIAFYAASTLWMLLLAWLGFWPGSILNRILLLIILVASLFAFYQFVEPRDLSGSAIVNVRWRESKTNQEFASAAGAAVLRTTPRDFPGFLGRERDGIVRGVDLDPGWNDRPPKLLWKQPIGEGWGAFSIVGDHAFTQEQRGDQECIVCYELATGKTVWIHANDAAFLSSAAGNGPRATPSIVDGRVYAVGATGIVDCLDGATGNLIWTTPLLEDPAGNLSHGVCGSPLVTDRFVYVSPVTNEDQSLAALDKETGKIVFSAGAARAAYSSPAWATLDGVNQVLVFNGSGLAGHKPDSGQVLWFFPWRNDSEVNASQPVIYRTDRDNIFLSTAYGIGATLLRIERGDDSWRAVPQWKSIKMKNKFTSSVLLGNYVVGLDEEILAAIDLENGKLLWKEGRYGHGQILLIGNLLLVLSEQGTLFLIRPSRDGAEVLGQVDDALTGKTWNNLAFAAPYLLIRNASEAACYELPLIGSSAIPAASPQVAREVPAATTSAAAATESEPPAVTAEPTPPPKAEITLPSKPETKPDDTFTTPPLPGSPPKPPTIDEKLPLPEPTLPELKLD